MLEQSVTQKDGLTYYNYVIKPHRIVSATATKVRVVRGLPLPSAGVDTTPAHLPASEPRLHPADRLQRPPVAQVRGRVPQDRRQLLRHPAKAGGGHRLA